jgi:hypothetical protein
LSASSRTKCDQLNCRDNWLLGESGGELDHPAQILFPEPAPVVPRELRGQGRQDFLAVPRPLPCQHFRMDALADTPEQQGQFGIDRRRGVLVRRLDQCPNVA